MFQHPFFIKIQLDIIGIIVVQIDCLLICAEIVQRALGIGKCPFAPPVHELIVDLPLYPVLKREVPLVKQFVQLLPGIGKRRLPVEIIVFAEVFRILYIRTEKIALRGRVLTALFL